MMDRVRQALEALIDEYDKTLKVMDLRAEKSFSDGQRAYGGFVRAAKGQIQEYLTKRLVEIAWVDNLGEDPERLEINSAKIPIPLKAEYLERVEDEQVREHIRARLHEYNYRLSVDRHVIIDGELVAGIECKAYTENAMLKRILVDFMLLKTVHPEMRCLLFQLESQLGGDYSALRTPTYGSTSTHTLCSYFPTVELEIITLLNGERKVDRPINKPAYFKPLEIRVLAGVVDLLSERLVP